MATYREIVSETGRLIAASELTDLLRPLWKSIEWVAHQESHAKAQAALSLALSNGSGEATINLYPALMESPEAGKQVLREFGKLILLRSGEKGKSIWEKKLDVPTPEQIQIAAAKLADSSVRQRCKRYKDVLDTYPDRGGSTNRLVFVHVANALLSNNISYADSVGVDINTWGPTTEYCRRKKYHSLIPLVSAYSPPEVYADFGIAFATLIIDNLSAVRDRSVGFALRGIIQRIAKLATAD